jgi:hypothetical protein
VAYDGCVIACGCPLGSHKIIASKNHVFVNINSDYNLQINPKSNSPLMMQEVLDNDIRLDAKRLLTRAKELSEKHLYHYDIK